MKKAICILMAAVMLLSLCACGSGGEDAEDVVFQNDLDVVIHSIYISSSTEDEWGDPVNSAKLNSGSSTHIDFDKFAGDGAYYDVGVVDENNVNYDVYEVSLAIGDTLALSESDGTPVLTVTGTDGKTATYDVYAYDG